MDVKIEFGVNKLKELKNILERDGRKRAVLVCDRLFKLNGTAGELKDGTPQIVAVFGDVSANPLLSDAKRAAEIMKHCNADCVVALGGGSSLDLAKFAASYVFAKGEAEEYFYKTKQFGKESLPLIAVPTTSGTGSEVTGVAVMSNGKTGEKAPLCSDNFYADIALVDPALTLSVPPFVTAATGLDAMAHAFEAYWCKAHNTKSDEYAVSALKLIFANLQRAYENGADLDARTAMSRGSLEAGLAFAPTRTAAVHACSYPLSEQYGMCHGEACAFTLDSFVRLNAKAEPERMNALFCALGFVDAEEAALEIVRLKKRAKLKITLFDAGITDTLELAGKCVAHPLMDNNPFKPTLQETKAVFDALE